MLYSSPPIALDNQLIFALRAATSTSPEVVDSVSNVKVLASGGIYPKKFEGHSAWDLDKTYMSKVSGSAPKIGQFYTFAVWVYWRTADDGQWRTLIRQNRDHSVIVQPRTNHLGMYSNRDGRFRGSSNFITDDMESWQLVIVTGEGDSPTSSRGTSRFYTAAEGNTQVRERGTADRVVSGTQFEAIGWKGQGPGKVAAVYQWDRVLTGAEMNQLLANGVDADPSIAPTPAPTPAPLTAQYILALPHYAIVNLALNLLREIQEKQQQMETAISNIQDDIKKING